MVTHETNAATATCLSAGLAGPSRSLPSWDSGAASPRQASHAGGAILCIVTFTKVKRNDVFQAVVAGGLDPSECEFTYGNNAATLRHDRSKSSFSMGDDGHDHYMGWSGVGDTKPERYGAGNWAGVLPLIQQWAADVKRYAEIDAVIPDLWEELRLGKEFLADVQNNNAGNTPFGPDEQAEIAQRLREIKERVQLTYSLTNEQMEHLDARFDGVEEASRRFGRKDWLLLFSGALFSLILTDSLPPNVAQHILISVLQSLGHLFGIGGPPPSIPPMA